MVIPALCAYPGSREPLRLREFCNEELPPGWVRVRGGTRSSCATDAAVIEGSHFIARSDREERFLILGHEAGGYICECGEGVDGVKEGMKCSLKTRYANPAKPHRLHELDRVDLSPVENTLVAGMFGMDGYFRSEFAVPVSGIVPLPEDFPMELSSLPDLISCVRKGLREAIGCRQVILEHLQVPPQRALVIGAGPSGLAAVRILVESGLKDVLVVDIIDESREKVQIALSAGAQVSYVNARGMAVEEVISTAKRLGPVDILFEASGSWQAGQAWSSALDAGGVLVWFGMSHGLQDKGALAAELLSSKMMRSIIEIYTINATSSDWLWSGEHLIQNADYYRRFFRPVLSWSESLRLHEVLKDPESVKPRILLPGE